jgi:uncharacterized membrane protein YhaH (DUF805 family)
MSWQFYLSPEGRVTRAEWWQKLFLPSFGLMFVTAILDAAFGLSSRHWPMGPISIVASWILLYPTIVVSVKRLHDHNKSGWWFLIYVVPVAGWFWQVVECGFLRGTLGDNRYGPDTLPPPYWTPDSAEAPRGNWLPDATRR